jgi:hypothetical protein
MRGIYLIIMSIRLSLGNIMGNDSLNMRFIGNRPFSRPYAVEYSPEIEVIFLGIGGGYLYT